MNTLFDGQEFSELAYSPSPVTGVTRQHWMSVADHLLAASERFPGPLPWLYRYPGAVSVNGAAMDGLEGFARTLLLGSFRMAGGSVEGEPRWIGQLQDGLAGGAEALARNDESAWAALTMSSQALVEAASIATSLAVARDQLWNPLSDGAKRALIGWLRQATIPRRHLNNWILFPATIAAALESLGHGDAAGTRILERLPRLISPWYLSEGWYSDGPGTRIDYYNAWGYHYYLPLIARFSGRRELIDLAKDGIQKFLVTFPGFFDGTGAPIYFGRSLTYRFGSLAPLWTAQLIGAEGLDPGALRAVASSGLRYFARNGAMADGALGIGWHGENPEIAQAYSSSASPLWSAKALVGLLLGPGHPAWSATETPMTRTHTPAAVQLTGTAGFLLSGSGEEGVTRLHVGGVSKWPDWSPQSREHDALYGRLAYSSITAPYSGIDSPENTVFVAAGGVQASPAPAHRTRVGPDWISSTSRLWSSTPRRFPPTYRWGRVTRFAKRLVAPEPWRRATVSVLTLVAGGGEVRVYRVRHAPPNSTVSIGLFAIAGVRLDPDTSHDASLTLTGDGSREDVRILTPGWRLSTDTRSDASNPFGAEVEIPTATATTDSRGNALLSVAIRLTRPTDDVGPWSGFTVSHEDDSLRVVAADSQQWLSVGLRGAVLLPSDWHSPANRKAAS